MGRKNNKVDVDSRNVVYAATLMGASFFMRSVFYFGLSRLEELGAGELLLSMILPMLLELGFLILLRGVRLNVPNVYSSMGAVYCLLLLLQSFGHGSILRTILEIVIYLACAALLVLVGMKLMKNELAAIAFFAAALVRILFDLGPYIFKFRLIALLPEAAAISGLLALGLFLLERYPQRAAKS